MRLRLTLLSALFASLLALAACGNDEATEANEGSGGRPPAAQEQPPQAEATDTIEIEDFEYLPPTATVQAGTEITWRNLDTTAHTASSEDGSTFDTGGIDDGKTGTVTAPEPGTYEYICEFHPTMHGTLVVE